MVLQKSSRNVYLSEDERLQAVELSRSLEMARLAIENGERNPEEIVGMMKSHLHENTTGTVDYIEIYSYPELQQIETLKGKVIIALAVKFSKARLIDNTILEVE